MPPLLRLAIPLVLAAVPLGAAPELLLLLAADGAVRSENRYWRGARPLDYKELDTLPPVALEAEVARSRTSDGERLLTAKVTNPAAAPAFALRVQVVDDRTGKRLLPILASDGRFTLMRGESRALTVRFRAAAERAAHAKLVLTPYDTAR